MHIGQHERHEQGKKVGRGNKVFFVDGKLFPMEKNHRNARGAQSEQGKRLSQHAEVSLVHLARLRVIDRLDDAVEIGRGVVQVFVFAHLRQIGAAGRRRKAPCRRLRREAPRGDRRRVSGVRSAT